MNNLLKKTPAVQPVENTENERFFYDALDLFTGHRSGHMNAYAFNEPDVNIPNDPVRGGEHWSNFIANSKDYYVISDESMLIQQTANAIGEMLPSNSLYVDLGSGETKAVEGKTLPFIKGLKAPTEFISVDVNSSFCSKAALTIYNSTNIQSSVVIGDFLKEELDITDKNRPTIMSLFGGLLCNAPYSKCLNGQEYLISAFKDLKNNMKTGDHLVITQDANQNKESLLKTYSHPDLAKYILSVLHKIKRDLPTEGFDPEAFEFVSVWDEENHLITLNARLKKEYRSLSFKLGRTKFNINAGQLLPLVNSYKFPIDKFIDAAKRAGMICNKTFISENKKTALHVLQYSPVLLK